MNSQNSHITQALEHLRNAHYAGYFEEMDKVEMSPYLQGKYNEIKFAYIDGKKSFNFPQILQTFTKEVAQNIIALPDTNIRVVKVYTSPPKTWQSWLQKLQGRQDQTYWQCLAYAPLGYNQDDITQTLTTYLPPLTKEAESKDEATLRKTYPLYEAEPDIETNFFNNKNKRILLLTGEVGTGKTTLMQKLFLQKAQQRVGKKIAFIYADQDTHAHIALAIAQGVQWLWIDAFDEDAQARQAQNETQYLNRLKSLMEQVQGVERVLLSIRTEFLPEDHIKNQIFNTNNTCFVDLGLFAKPQILEHLTTHAYMRKENFVKALREQLHKNNIFLSPFLFSRAEEILMEYEGAYKQTPYAYTYQVYQKVVENWAGREQDKKNQGKAPNWVGFAGKVMEFCERVALYFYEGRQAIHYKEIEQQRETLGLDLHDARNHALLVRDERGNYHFTHNVFLDYFIAQNLLKGNIREEDLDKQKYKRSYDLYEEMYLGDLSKDKEVLEKKLSIEPNNVKVFHELALVYLGMSDYTNALQTVERGLRIESANKYLLAIQRNILNTQAGKTKTQASETAGKITQTTNKDKWVLFLWAMPSGTQFLEISKECNAVRTALQRTKIRVYECPNVNKDEFMNETIDKEPTILHFSGHGTNGTMAGLIIQNEHKNGVDIFTPPQIKALFQDFTEEFPISAVIFNACYSQEQAKIIQEYVPHVIGTEQKIKDEHALAFSKGFYAQLARNPDNIVLAYKRGKTRAVAEGADETDFILFT